MISFKLVFVGGFTGYFERFTHVLTYKKLDLANPFCVLFNFDVK